MWESAKEHPKRWVFFEYDNEVLVYDLRGMTVFRILEDGSLKSTKIDESHILFLRPHIRLIMEVAFHYTRHRGLSMALRFSIHE